MNFKGIPGHEFLVVVDKITVIGSPAVDSFNPHSIAQKRTPTQPQKEIFPIKEGLKAFEASMTKGNLKVLIDFRK